MLVHRHDPPDRFVVGTVGEPGARTFFLQARTGRLVTSVSLEKQQVSILAERIGVLLDELKRTGDVADDSPAGADADPLDQPLVEEFRVGTMTLSWDADDQRVVIEAFPVGDEDAADPATTDDGLAETTADPALDPIPEPLPEAVTDQLTDELVDELVDELAAELPSTERLGVPDPDAAPDSGTGEAFESSASEVFLVRLAPPAARGFASRAETVVSAGRPPCPFCGQPLDPEGHLCPRANGFKRVAQ